MSFLSRLFSRGSSGEAGAEPDGGLYVFVRCDNCHEVIRARVNPTSDLSLQEDGRYFVRKVLVGTRCFRPIEARLHYADTRGTLVEREADGGTYVDGPDAPPVTA